jgi:uncharacterized protein (UPF0333 family)
MASNAHPLALRGQRGQASVEYIVVAMAVLISIAVVSAVGQRACIQNMAGDTSAAAAECKDIHRAVGASLKKSVEEVTFLINLPF